jgi:NADP-dependent 3-hydroxy acid dehydrogenase YdfG
MSDPVLEAKPILERFRLDGRVALVTGGGQGIGRAFAHALGEAGAAVAVVDMRLDVAEAVAHELAQKQIDAIAVQTNVTKPEEVQAMVDAILAKWGKLTIACNNAGVGVWADAESMAYAEWLRVIDVNLNSVFLCAQAEAKVMLAAGYGKIINTASMSGHISNTPQNQAVYNASKAGVLHLTRSLAAEWAHARRLRQQHQPRLHAHQARRGSARHAHRPDDAAGVDGHDADGAHGRGHRPARSGGLSGLGRVGLHDGPRYGDRWRILLLVKQTEEGTYQ